MALTSCGCLCVSDFAGHVVLVDDGRAEAAVDEAKNSGDRERYARSSHREGLGSGVLRDLADLALQVEMLLREPVDVLARVSQDFPRRKPVGRRTTPRSG